MQITAEEKDILRELAKRVAEIAAEPGNAELRNLWKKHNSLQQVRPMVLVNPEDSWSELIPDTSLQAGSELGRCSELQLRKRIYHWEHLKDDSVVEAEVIVPLVCTKRGWGLEIKRVYSSQDNGGFRYEHAIREPADFARMKPQVIEIDYQLSRDNYLWLKEVIGDIVPVRLWNNKSVYVDNNLVDTLAAFRGAEQLMLDMYERPQWIHEIMEFMTESALNILDDIEKDGALELNNGPYYQTGGIFYDYLYGIGERLYTDELPSADFDGKNVKLKDMWSWTEAQEFVGVSPDMHYEFGLQYQSRIMGKFGLNSYGCCEPLHQKLKYVKQIPNIRRISISPWADVRSSAEQLLDEYIFSWKPKPFYLAEPEFNTEIVRAEIAKTLKITREHNCNLELVLNAVGRRMMADVPLD